MAIEQPFTIEHAEKRLTLSGVKQALELLPPENLKRLEQELQSLLTWHVSKFAVIPGPAVYPGTNVAQEVHNG